MLDTPSFSQISEWVMVATGALLFRQYDPTSAVTWATCCSQAPDKLAVWVQLCTMCYLPSSSPLWAGWWQARHYALAASSGSSSTCAAVPLLLQAISISSCKSLPGSGPTQQHPVLTNYHIMFWSVQAPQTPLLAKKIVLPKYVFAFI